MPVGSFKPLYSLSQDLVAKLVARFYFDGRLIVKNQDIHQVNKRDEEVVYILKTLLATLQRQDELKSRMPARKYDIVACKHVNKVTQPLYARLLALATNQLSFAPPIPVKNMVEPLSDPKLEAQARFRGTEEDDLVMDDHAPQEKSQQESQQAPSRGKQEAQEDTKVETADSDDEENQWQPGPITDLIPKNRDNLNGRPRSKVPEEDLDMGTELEDTEEDKEIIPLDKDEKQQSPKPSQNLKSKRKTPDTPSEDDDEEEDVDVLEEVSAVRVGAHKTKKFKLDRRIFNVQVKVLPSPPHGFVYEDQKFSDKLIIHDQLGKNLTDRLPEGMVEAARLELTELIKGDKSITGVFVPQLQHGSILQCLCWKVTDICQVPEDFYCTFKRMPDGTISNLKLVF